MEGSTQGGGEHTGRGEQRVNVSWKVLASSPGELCGYEGAHTLPCPHKRLPVSIEETDNVCPHIRFMCCVSQSPGQSPSPSAETAVLVTRGQALCLPYLTAGPGVSLGLDRLTDIKL